MWKPYIRYSKCQISSKICCHISWPITTKHKSHHGGLEKCTNPASQNCNEQSTQKARWQDKTYHGDIIELWRHLSRCLRHIPGKLFWRSKTSIPKILAPRLHHPKKTGCPLRVIWFKLQQRKLHSTFISAPTGCNPDKTHLAMNSRN